MYFLIYSAYPKKGTNEYERYATAHIACWINTNDRETARSNARRLVERTNWMIDKVEEDYSLTRN
jgi:hypothetical protein